MTMGDGYDEPSRKPMGRAGRIAERNRGLKEALADVKRVNALVREQDYSERLKVVEATLDELEKELTDG